MKVGRYVTSEVVIRQNDAVTAKVAASIARAIRSADGRLVVEHVGSTAVPGCAGKGTVDVVVGYPAGCLAVAKSLLRTLGFQAQAGRDPFPESRPMRVGSVRSGGRSYNVHVHVLKIGGKEMLRMMAFRDRLCADAGLRRKYVGVKRALVAAGTVDSVDYAHAKASFFKDAS
jgi:GrpB-like predicted nucleotidyltransferase (UPF0157 family)